MEQQSETGSPRRKIASDLPRDRFDRKPKTGRIGAHRVNARPRYIWQYLIASVAAFVLLTGAGIFWLQTIGTTGLPLTGAEGNSTTTETSRAPEPKVDPAAEVAVLNGTSIPSLATAVDRQITQENWGTIIFSGDAAAHDVQISAVFYSAPEDAAAAAGLAAQLGGLSTYVTTDYDAYGASLIVLLGSDYAGPGLDEAAAIAAETPAPTAPPLEEAPVDEGVLPEGEGAAPSEEVLQ